MRSPLVFLIAPLVALVSLPPSPAGAQTAMEHARRCVELVNARSDLERAVEHCSRAIASRAFKGVNLAPLYYNRGWARDELGQREAAIEDYSSAIAIQTDLLQAYVARGYAPMVGGALEAAMVGKAARRFSVVRLFSRSPVSSAILRSRITCRNRSIT